MIALSTVLSDDFGTLTGARAALLSMLDSNRNSLHPIEHKARNGSILDGRGRLCRRISKLAGLRDAFIVARHSPGRESHALVRPALCPTRGVDMATRTTREVSADRVSKLIELEESRFRAARRRSAD